MANEHHGVVGAVLDPEPSEGLRLLVEEPDGGFEEAVVDVAAIEHLHAQAVIKKELVVALLGKVEAADGEDDLAVIVIEVNDVGRGVTLSLLVGDALDKPIGIETVAAGGGELGAAEIRLVDG